MCLCYGERENLCKSVSFVFAGGWYAARNLIVLTILSRILTGAEKRQRENISFSMSVCLSKKKKKKNGNFHGFHA